MGCAAIADASEDSVRAILGFRSLNPNVGLPKKEEGFRAKM